MKVLVVGGGAREHALAWKLRQESGVSAVVTAPGNPGTALLGPAYPVSVTDIDGLVDLARSEAHRPDHRRTRGAARARARGCLCV